jgi:hypothetical protein
MEYSSEREWMTAYYDIKSELEQEFQNGQPRQSWTLVPARKILSVWMQYGKYGRVNEQDLLDIWSIVQENIIKICINSDIRDGRDLTIFGQANEDTGEDREYNDITEEEWDRFFEFISDGSNASYGRGADPASGHARYSDGSNHLARLWRAAEAVEQEPEKLLWAIDKILNFVHGIGNMAGWFVEGGVKTLNQIADYQPQSGMH